MSKIRAAILGSGLIAGKKHIPAFRKLQDKAELVALCDVNLQAARNVAAKFGVPKAYGDLNEMLTTEKPQLVNICTPPQTHVKLAVEVMKRGCHVLIEKPMALTVADCDQIVEASQRYGVKVCVAHSDLFYAPFIEARERMARGEIGSFRGMRIFLSTPTDYMTAHKDHWAHRLPGGVIGETGPHIVYMTLAFLSPIRSVSVDAVKLMDQYPWSRYEDYRIDLVGDAGVSSVVLSYSTSQWAARVEILGEMGFLLLDLQGMHVLRYRRPELKVLPVGLSVVSEAAQMLANAVATAFRVLTGGTRSTHEVILSRFLDSIRNGTSVPVTAEEGREAVRVLSMIVAKLDEQSAHAASEGQLAAPGVSAEGLGVR